MGIINDSQKQKIKTATNLIKRFQHHSGGGEDAQINWGDIISWYEKEVLPHVCSSTHKKYKSALLFVAEDLNLKKLFTKRANPKSELPIKRTSRMRSKRLSYEDMELLKAHNKRTNSKWGLLVVTWLSAALHTGLRPHEWLFAELSETGDFLIVENKKLEETIPGYKASKRMIPLSYLDEEQKKEVSDTLENIGDFGLELYDFLYMSAANWLYRANKKIWKRRSKTIALMTPRHQFQANLKASDLTPKEIAYIVGHHADDRSYESYGSRSHGNKIGLDSSYIPPESLNRIVAKIEAKWKKRRLSKAMKNHDNDADLSADNE